jgi:hypothetical protein
MAYTMHRIFCATPGDLEEERQAFYKVMGEFNEAHAMPRGILFVSISIVPYGGDKRTYQGAVSENIRSCRYYIQVLEDTWGPPEKNFERDYAVARRSLEDPALPMQDVVVLFKKPLLPHQVEPGIAQLKESMEVHEFSTLEEYRDRLRKLLTGWIETVSPMAEGA